MIILIEDAVNEQYVKFIGRSLHSGNDGQAVFTDEQTNVSYTYTGTLTTDRYYNEFYAVLTDLKDDRHYTVSIGYSLSKKLISKMGITK